MGEGYGTLGFVVIVVLYLTIGVLAALGCVAVGRRFLGPRVEQVFYGIFLVLIAAFYLAFAAYFGMATALRVESAAVVVFFVIGSLGARVPIALIIGYPMHALWDLLHEFQQQGSFSAFGPGQLTTVPLAYGLFCAAFDLCMAGYFAKRRFEWNAAWQPAPAESVTEP
jgi:hypothetical protein